MGGGSFNTWANYEIVRTDGDKPTEASLQEARRDVLAHCIYGVDKDDFAVELCKIALWMHCTLPTCP